MLLTLTTHYSLLDTFSYRDFYSLNTSHCLPLTSSLLKRTCNLNRNLNRNFNLPTATNTLINLSQPVSLSLSLSLTSTFTSRAALSLLLVRFLICTLLNIACCIAATILVMYPVSLHPCMYTALPAPPCLSNA